MPFYKFGNLKRIFAKVRPDSGLQFIDVDSPSMINVSSCKIVSYFRTKSNDENLIGGAWVNIPVPDDADSVVDYIPDYIDELVVTAIIPPIDVVSMEELKEDANALAEALERNAENGETAVSFASRIASNNGGIVLKTSKNAPVVDGVPSLEELIPLIYGGMGGVVYVDIEWGGPHSLEFLIRPDSNGDLTVNPFIDDEPTEEPDLTVSCPQKYAPFFKSGVIDCNIELPDLMELYSECVENGVSEEAVIKWEVRLTVDASALSHSIDL